MPKWLKIWLELLENNHTLLVVLPGQVGNSSTLHILIGSKLWNYIALYWITFHFEHIPKRHIIGAETKTSKENSDGISFPCVDIRLPDWMRDDSLDLFCDAWNK